MKRPVSSVKMQEMGNVWMAMTASRGIVANGVDVGMLVGGCVEHMCCPGCAMCPMLVSSASGQQCEAKVAVVRPGHDA